MQEDNGNKKVGVSVGAVDPLSSDTVATSAAKTGLKIAAVVHLIKFALPILGIALIISLIMNIWSIILALLGFISMDDFTSTLSSEENAALVEALTDYYSTSDNREALSNALLSYDSSGEPVSGALLDIYTQIDENYNSLVSGVYEDEGEIVDEGDEEGNEEETDAVYNGYTYSTSGNTLLSYNSSGGSVSAALLDIYTQTDENYTFLANSVYEENKEDNEEETDVVYDGYTISSDFDNFWEDSTMISWLATILQTYVSESDINTIIASTDTSLIYTDLVAAFDSMGCIADWSVDQTETEETETQTTSETTSGYYFSGTEEEAAALPTGLSSEITYTEDTINGLTADIPDGYATWMEYFQSSSNSFWVYDDNITVSSTVDVSVTHVNLVYTISPIVLSSSQSSTDGETDSSSSTDYSSYVITDEDTLQSAVDLIELVGDPDTTIWDYITKGASAVYNFLKGGSSEANQVLDQMNTAVSWRDLNSAYGTTYYGGNGQAIVDYALQFVGNPYKIGGNSLTNGIDCSHFVWQVLMNSIGYTGGYCTSTNWATKGTKVNSLAEAQPGDILVFPKGSSGYGHVAIYVGEGSMVHAKGRKYGIVLDTGINIQSYHGGLMAIRRFVSSDISSGSISTSISGVEDAYKALVQAGFSPAGACGILGNAMQESSFKPTTVSKTGKFYGLFQWSGNRLTRLKSFCASNGYDYTSIQGQLNFMIAELTATKGSTYYDMDYSKLLTYLKTTTDPETAAVEFAVRFERCVNGKYEYTGSLYPYAKKYKWQGLAGRKQWAREFYNKYAK